MARRHVLSWLFVALAFVALVASVPQALGPDPGSRVTLKTATGEEKELTVQELEAYMETENAKQQAMQADEAGADGKSMHERLSDIEKHDPHFARMIRVSRYAFQVIQRHGYASEYELKGFSERDLKLTPQQLNEQVENKEERMVLALRAKKSYTSKDHSAPEEISLEVDLLVFEDDADFSISGAWELDASDRRARRLSVKPSPAAIKRAKEKKSKQKAKPKAEAEVADNLSQQVFLIVGVALLVGGFFLMMSSAQDSKAQWELKNK